MDYEAFQVRYNIMNISSVMAFANVVGGLNGSEKDVYFIRCIGCNAGYLTDIKQMDSVLSRREGNGRYGYARIEKFPQMTQNPEDVAYYIDAYEQWERSGRFDAKKIPQAVMNHALEKAVQVYTACTPNANATIIKNVMIKMLFWTNTILSRLFSEWEERGSYKLAVCGVLKKQEYLFCYYATMLGIDVILLSPEKELELETQLLDLSARLDLEQKAKTVFPEYRPERKKVHAAKANPAVKSRVDPVEKSFEELAQLASSVVMITIHDRKGEVIGTGSGIMISSKGYILTNNHVASGGSYYSVRIENDEEIYQTDEVIKYHPLFDLALIRIDRVLRPIPLYQGKKGLARGQSVVAIGSPLGFFNSVSDGIISGFRNIDGINMIQFTAPISRGSSGGAVLNLYGEVIGISTAGIDSGQNINLAVDYQDITAFVRGFL